MCTDLVELSQPPISQHLNEIKKVGLLKPSFKGKNGYYAINKEKWQDLQMPFYTLFTKLNATTNKSAYED